MPVRTGEQYLDGLRDGREVWLEGERVDVTSEPRMSGFARSVAELFDLQHDRRYLDLLTMPSPSSSGRISLSWIIPRTKEDLVRRRRLTELMMRRTGGVVGRPPEFMALVVLGLYDARDMLAEEDPAFADNAVRYFEPRRENDLCLTH